MIGYNIEDIIIKENNGLFIVRNIYVNVETVYVTHTDIYFKP